MKAINNITEFGTDNDRFIDAARDRAAAEAYEKEYQVLITFTDKLAEMSYEETLEAMDLQPGLVARAISVLAYKAGYKVGILPF